MSARTVSVAVVALAAMAIAFAVGRVTAPANETDTGSGGEREILYWVAPMDPSYRRDGPGKSPMGMDLVPVYAGDAPEGDAIDVSPAVMRTLGVRTEPVRRGGLEQSLETIGTVVWDEATVERLHPYVAGWLRQVNVEAIGDDVAAGDVVFTLYSPELVSAQREYLAAAGSPRLKASAAERLRTLGMTAAQIDALARRGRASETIDYVSRRDAVVIDIAARDGSYVMPSTPIVTLAEATRVWVEIDVAQQQAGLVSAGQTVSVDVDAWPGEHWQGRVAYVYPALDSETRTLRARIELDNEDGRLKPGMLAQVRLEAPPTGPLLSVPREAVIPGASGERVVVALGDGRFAVRPVITGRRGSGRIEIVRGLDESAEVVVAGQFLLDAEADGEQALRRLSADAGGPAPSLTRGEIVALDRAAGWVTLDHEAIESPAMMAMTMRFDTAIHIDLSDFSEGDRVRFAIARDSDGKFRVIRLEADETPGGSMTPGRIVAIDAAARRVTIDHAAIESPPMMAMTMSFAAPESIDLSGFGDGDRVRFSIRRRDDGRFELTALTRAEP